MRKNWIRYHLLRKPLSWWRRFLVWLGLRRDTPHEGTLWIWAASAMPLRPLPMASVTVRLCVI